MGLTLSKDDGAGGLTIGLQAPDRRRQRGRQPRHSVGWDWSRSEVLSTAYLRLRLAVAGRRYIEGGGGRLPV